MRRTLAMLLVAALAACATDGARPSLQRGQVVADRVTVGRLTLPLPEGRWEVIGTTTTANNLGAQLQSVVLGEFDQRDLRRSIVIHASVDSASQSMGWVEYAGCRQRDQFFVTVKSMYVSDQNCAFVDVVGAFPTNAQSQEIRDAALEIRTRTGRAPVALPTIIWRRADLSNVLTYFYSVNPEPLGLPPAVGTPNPWSRDNVAADPRRQQVIDDLIARAQSFAPRVDAAFHGRL